MTNPRYLATCSLIAGLALALAAPPAHAASSIFTGGVVVGSLQLFDCEAMNTSSTKTLTGVRVLLRKSDASITATRTCDTVVPLGACGSFFSENPGPGTVTCEATSDQGARFLRATLSNEATGNSSDAR